MPTLSKVSQQRSPARLASIGAISAVALACPAVSGVWAAPTEGVAPQHAVATHHMNVTAHATAASTAAPVTANPDSDDLAPFVVGGTEASSNPGAVALTFQGEKLKASCTGSLVAPQWVLSAKHCILEGRHNNGTPVDLPNIRINSLQRESGGELVTAVHRVDAPDGDMALFQLPEPVSGTTVQLATSNPAKGATVDIYGWGATEVKSEGPRPQSPVLKTATMTMNRTFSDNKGGPGLWLDGDNGASYNGDSGGPAFSGGVQVGVCSAGAAGQKISIYGSVAKNHQWITSVIGSTPKPAPTPEPAPTEDFLLPVLPWW